MKGKMRLNSYQPRYNSIPRYDLCASTLHSLNEKIITISSRNELFTQPQAIYIPPYSEARQPGLQTQAEVTFNVLLLQANVKSCINVPTVLLVVIPDLILKIVFQWELLQYSQLNCNAPAQRSQALKSQPFSSMRRLLR